MSVLELVVPKSCRCFAPVRVVQANGIEIIKRLENSWIESAVMLVAERDIFSDDPVASQQKVSIGVKYFHEFDCRSTYQGYTLPISGAVTFRSSRVSAVESARLTRLPEKFSCSQEDGASRFGLIGFDFIRNFRMTIDYQQQIIVFDTELQNEGTDPPSLASRLIGPQHDLEPGSQLPINALTEEVGYEKDPKCHIGHPSVVARHGVAI